METVGSSACAADSISFFGGPPIGELIAREVGTLDRRGESIEMVVSRRLRSTRRSTCAPLGRIPVFVREGANVPGRP